jgi:hypothetical protein
VEGSRQHIGEPSLVAVGRAGLPVIEDRVQPVDLTLRETAPNSGFTTLKKVLRSIAIC